MSKNPKAEGAVIPYYMNLQAYPWPQTVRTDPTDMNVLGDVPAVAEIKGKITKLQLKGLANAEIYKQLLKEYPYLDGILARLLAPQGSMAEAGDPNVVASVAHGLAVSAGTDKHTVSQVGTKRPEGMEVYSGLKKPFTRNAVSAGGVSDAIVMVGLLPQEQAAEIVDWAANNPGKCVKVAAADGDDYYFVYDFQDKAFKDTLAPEVSA